MMITTVIIKTTTIVYVQSSWYETYSMKILNFKSSNDKNLLKTIVK